MKSMIITRFTLYTNDTNCPLPYLFSTLRPKGHTSWVVSHTVMYKFFVVINFQTHKNAKIYFAHVHCRNLRCTGQMTKLIPAGN